MLNEGNFFIKSNEENDLTELNIFGDIGESWFGDSVTFQGIQEQLSGVNTSKIVLNISTYGGDVNHAFSIYNILKTHPSKIEANIMGFTASAGTIIAMAADSIKMDENTMFLVHNAWTAVAGNQHDLRETADELEKIDNRLIAIYKKKTGKRKDQISKLMQEEKWISAKEAKDFGFIDEVYEPMKAAASVIKSVNYINSSNKLPKISMDNLNLENLESSIFEKVMNGVKEIFAKKEKEVSSEALEAEIRNQISALQNEVNERLAALNVVSEEDFNNLKEENESFKNKVAELEAEIAKNSANPINPKADVDPDLTDAPKAETEGQKILKGIYNDLTMGEKAILQVNSKK